jgi:hypothetical protein
VKAVELDRRRTLCPGCDEEYPLACGACPSCGTLALQPSAGDRFSVFVPEVPSARQRAEVAAYLEKLLDCPGGGRALEAALAAGQLRLVDDLDEAPARALAAALGRKHVQGARVEPTRPSATPFPWTWVPGYLPLVLGLVVGVVTAIPLGAGLLGGVVLSGLAMLVHRKGQAKTAASALAMPVIAVESLAAWRPIAKQLTALLPTLPPQVRAPLGKLATSAAFVVDEYGEGSTPARSALELVATGLTLARSGAEPAALSAQLTPLAEAAGRARAELTAPDGARDEQAQQRIADTLGQAARAALPQVS